jgi:hypothetical protein
MNFAMKVSKGFSLHLVSITPPLSIKCVSAPTALKFEWISAPWYDRLVHWLFSCCIGSLAAKCAAVSLEILEKVYTESQYPEALRKDGDRILSGVHLTNETTQDQKLMALLQRANVLRRPDPPAPAAPPAPPPIQYAVPVNGNMTVAIQTATRITPIKISSTDTVGSLKQAVHETIGWSVETIRLICNGRVLLTSAYTLADYEVRDGATIHCVFRQPS